MSVLSLRKFCVEYANGAHAVRNVSLVIERGEQVVVLGESGCGKSTLAKALLRLLPASSKVHGRVRIDGTHHPHDSNSAAEQSLRGLIAGFVPQNPLTAFNPFMSVGSQLREAWTCHGKSISRDDLIKRLEDAGLSEAAGYLDRRPAEWSGGMLQRALIIAATAHDPVLVVADEPTSAIDRPLARQMLELLVDRSETLFMISHDVDLVQDLATRILVMYSGTVLEDGPANDVLTRPKHPYTLALLAALPTPGKLPTELPGEPPSLSHTPRGCVFAPRCQYAVRKCNDETPTLADGVACHYPLRGTA
jgi:peptide/nickel transport system ATP-binding protein